jgi:hypothetical protein
MDVRDSEPAVVPVAAAGVLLAARTLGTDRGLDMPSVGAIVEATGVSRSRAYEVRDTILALLPSLVRPPGRPASEPATAPPELVYTLRGEVLRFVQDHPGCVHGGADRKSVV